MAKLAIIGAHTLVGRAVTEAIADRGLDGEVVPATTTDNIEAGLHLIDAQALDGADAIFLTASDAFSERLAGGAARLGAPVIDLAEILPPGSVPSLFPRLDLDLANRLGASSAFRVPLGLASSVVAVLRVLEGFGLRDVRVLSLEGASSAGQAGMEELSAQTRGVFTGQDAPPEVFYRPLAFGILSSVGDEDLPFGPDAAFAADVQAGLASPLVELQVARLRAPVFTGEGAWLSFRLEDPPPTETVVDLLAEGRGLRAAKGPAVGTLEAVDREETLFGRVRVEDDRIDLFVVSDRVRAAGASGALIAEAVLTRAARLSD